MSQNISISLSNECVFYINELKKKDQYFSVSKFFNVALTDYYNERLKISPRSSITEEKLQELENQIHQLKHEKIEKETEEEEKKREEEENKKKKEKRDLESKYVWMSNVQYFYGLEQDESRTLADAYFSLPKEERGTIFSFMKERNFKEIR